MGEKKTRIEQDRTKSDRAVQGGLGQVRSGQQVGVKFLSQQKSSFAETSHSNAHYCSIKKKKIPEHFV